MTTSEKKSDEVTFEITQHIGVIAKYNNHWAKELNKISWNGSNPKFDIRDWDEDHEHMSRGITLHENEIKVLYELLKDFYPEVLLQNQAV